MTSSRGVVAALVLSLLAAMVVVVPAHATGWESRLLSSQASPGKYMDVNATGAGNWWGNHGTVRANQQFGGAINQLWFAFWQLDHTTQIRTWPYPEGPDACLTAARASWVPSGWIVETSPCMSPPSSMQNWRILYGNRIRNEYTQSCVELDAGAVDYQQITLGPCRDISTQWTMG